MTQSDAVQSFLRAADESQTEALGAALGGALREGGVVALIGPLGAGKTRLAQAIAKSLGADPSEVSSPTFVLIQEYAAAVPLYHCDAYRLKSVDEFLDLGIDEMLAGPGVVLIEWADRVADVLPRDHLRVEITVKGQTQREFALHGAGPISAAIVGEVAETLERSRSGVAL